jgi:hypothetical protein
MILWFALWPLLTLLVWWFLFGRPGQSFLSVEQSTPLLVKPVPLGYPSTVPAPNEVMGAVEPGQHLRVVSDQYGKDYHVFRVVLPDGREGYVVDGKGVRVK